MKRFWRSGLVVCAVIVVIAAGAAILGANQQLLEAIYPPASKSRSSSMELVDIALDNDVTRKTLRLRVPKAYMVRAENWRGGKQRYITIETQLPDMKPAPAFPKIEGAPGSKEQEDSIRRFKNGVTLDLWSGNANVDVAKRNILARLSNERRRVGAPTKYMEKSSGIEGLRRFDEWACRQAESTTTNKTAGREQEDCRDWFYEHYFGVTDGAYFYAICPVWDKPTLGFRLGCQVKSTFRTHGLDYGLRYSELHRWREFDGKIRELLDSFVHVQ